MRLKVRSCLLFFTLALVCLLLRGPSNSAQIDVDVAHPGAAISPQMYGIFFEDVNFAADGGLYPELVKNRSFEFSESLTGWHEIYHIVPTGADMPKGELDVGTNQPLNALNPHYLHARVYEPGYGFYNTGYRGMGVKSGAAYYLSAYVRSDGPKALRATLTDDTGKVVGSGSLTGFGGGAWKRYETVIKVSDTAAKARLNLYVDERGALDLDMISLFPVDTWKGRRNGLRKDLVQMLYDMHPGFIRFPGGCIVEGRRLATRYRWKSTVGDISERKTMVSRWNDEFDQRPAPDYFQSFGLGFYEYFQLAEDLGARPLPVLNCGMACQFNTNETEKMEELHEYVQDALDLIEFANGPVSSPWGKLRAQMGHPAPFHMEILGIGNEQWGPRYIERYKVFAAALKAKHPEIQLVASVGMGTEGETFNTMWRAWRELKPDFVDEHYYMSPEWFLANSGRYDHYDRSGPKVYAGEYAAQTAWPSSPDNKNNWRVAISEAAFMTGLERNGDVVRLGSYASLLANADAWQWTPDAIWFDSLRAYGTPSYYVQQVFGSNAGTRVVPATPHAENGLYTSATMDERTNELILKVVNVLPAARAVNIRLGDTRLSGTAKVTTLESADLNAENSFAKPGEVSPKMSTAEFRSGWMGVRLGASSVNVYRISMR